MAFNDYYHSPNSTDIIHKEDNKSSSPSPNSYSKHPVCTLSPHQWDYGSYEMHRSYSSPPVGWHHYHHGPVPTPPLPPPHFDGISQSVREAFIPPRHNFTKPVTPERPSKPSPSLTKENSEVTFGLQENDIVCGRGAPSNAHCGNLLFRELTKDFQTNYLCAKRADKPKIAMHVMDEIQARGGRFVRRVKTASNGRGFGWEEISSKKAYEKVCQALREGAPELRRKMMASEARLRQEINKRDDEETAYERPIYGTSYSF